MRRLAEDIPLCDERSPKPPRANDFIQRSFASRELTGRIDAVEEGFVVGDDAGGHGRLIGRWIRKTLAGPSLYSHDLQIHQ
jgi:hypothetical protein